MNVNREFDLGTMTGMRDQTNKDVELYFPRKCTVTSKILGPGDKSSVQINLPKVDVNGRIIKDQFEEIIAISGYIRSKGRSEFELEKVLRARGLYPIEETN